MTKLPAVKRFVTAGDVRIYRIACQVLKALTGRVYLLLGAGPPTLLDTASGRGESIQQILTGLEEVRTEFAEAVRPSDIRRILLSHGHIDHVGGLWELLKTMKAEVGIHPLDCRAITAAQERAVVGKRRMMSFLQRAGVDPKRRDRLLRGSCYNLSPRPKIPVDISLEDGLELDGLRFVHTPGHSPGHLCLIVGDVLLCADHILARTIPQTWPESMIPCTGLGQYLESLEKVRRIGGLDLALAGHEPVIRNVYKRIDGIRETHMRRLDRLLDTLREAGQPLAIDEITKLMFSPRTGLDAILALADVGARVEYLHQRGQLTVANLDEVEAEENPVYRYCVA